MMKDYLIASPVECVIRRSTTIRQRKIQELHDPISVFKNKGRGRHFTLYYCLGVIASNSFFSS